MVRVELAVYDLSRGLASSMSQQILGQRIDGIWHTGVVVYNNEYYFGGGIQCSPYGNFSASQGLYPVQLLVIGETNQTKQSLEQYIASINHRFTANTYDLLTNNCNNFSDTICRFLCSTGIPSYIVDLPSIVLSTPGGQAFRPMIEQMQASVRMQSGSALPFGGSTSSSSSNSFNTFVNTSSQGISASTSSSAAFGNSSSNVSFVASNSSSIALIKATLEESPLVSSDSGTIKVLSPKLLGLQLADDEKAILSNIIDALSLVPIDHKRLTQLDFDVLYRIMNSNKQVEMNCLFLLRLMVIPRETARFSTTIINDILKRLSAGQEAFNSVSSLVMAICILANYMSHDDGISYIYNNTVSLTLVSSSTNGAESSVSIGQDCQDIHRSDSSQSEPLIQQVVDVALKMTTHSRVEVRQMTFALLYNIVLIHTKSGANSTSSSDDEEEIPQHMVEVICNCIQSADEGEADKLVRRRKLAIILRIIRRYGKKAVDLLSDLGYDSSVKDMHRKASNISDGDEKTIIAEILHRITTTTTSN